ncbi:hypothetical protein [Allomuricauda sp. R78024]|uniref:hypothetical protein n=1 Tax=Allomuricauda sp. R78024 TaxID=3093867 RepID=UPI0037C6648A
MSQENNELNTNDLTPLLSYIQECHEGDLLSFTQSLDKTVFMFHFIPWTPFQIWSGKIAVIFSWNSKRQLWKFTSIIMEVAVYDFAIFFDQLEFKVIFHRTNSKT